MKIQINFDLLSKIKEANTGMSLKRSACKMLVGTACTTALTLPYIMNDTSNGEDFGMNFLMILLAQTIYTINSNKLFADKYKEIASIKLNKVLSLLGNLDLNVNYEDLLNAYTYCTEYEDSYDEGFLPKIVQRKYFLIPFSDGCEINDISLIQEHVLGSNVYDISCGRKEKKLELSLQRA